MIQRALTPFVILSFISSLNCEDPLSESDVRHIANEEIAAASTDSLSETDVQEIVDGEISNIPSDPIEYDLVYVGQRTGNGFDLGETESDTFDVIPDGNVEDGSIIVGSGTNYATGFQTTLPYPGLYRAEMAFYSNIQVEAQAGIFNIFQLDCTGDFTNLLDHEERVGMSNGTTVGEKIRTRTPVDIYQLIETDTADVEITCYANYQIEWRWGTGAIENNDVSGTVDSWLEYIGE